MVYTPGRDIRELRQAAGAGYPRGPELTRKHVGANVEAAPVRCYGSLARTHTRVKDLHGIGVRYLAQRLIRACRKRVPSPFRLNGSNGGDVGHDFRMNDGEYYSPTDPTVVFNACVLLDISVSSFSSEKIF